MPIDPRFIACLFEPGDLLEVRLIPNPFSLFCKASELLTLEVRLQQANAAGQHVYIGANPRRRRGGKAADVALARSVFVDFDDITSSEARQRIGEAGLPEPTIAVYSGHGMHAYWRLLEPITDLQRWTTMQKSLIQFVASDPAIHDSPRIMRLPTFMNHKAPPTMAKVIDTPEPNSQRRYDISRLIPPTSAATTDSSKVGDHWLIKALARAQSGTRNDTGLWLACQLRDSGLTQSHAEPFLRSYADQQDGDYTSHEALASLQSAYTRTARRPAKGSASSTVAAITEHADPPIVPFEDDRLPEVSPDVLPNWARQMALELSRAKEVSPTMAVLLELAVVGSCVQRRYRLHVEGSYTEPLCLYTAPALESGERKTAVHAPIVRPLFTFQSQLREQAEAEQQAATIQRKLAEQQIRAVEKEYLKADVNKQQAIAQQVIELTAKLPQVQPLPQLVLEDFTEAALGIALATNRESLLVTSDEGGLFDNLSGRHNEVSEIDLFLKAHTGSPHTVNRVGRENILLTRPLLSVAISPQPAVLARLAGKEGFTTRGLTARFLWALPSSKVGYRKLEPMTIGESTLAEYGDHIMRLARIGREHEGEPVTLALSMQAHAIWKHFERELEPRLARDGDLRTIKSWASKLPGAVIRIAGVCHCGTHIEHAGLHEVHEWQMSAAVDVGRQLIPHALAAHRLMGGIGVNTAQAVVRHYATTGWPLAAQSLTEWWRPVRSIVGETSRDFGPVAQSLVDQGYLISVASPHNVGRPSNYFRANRALNRRE